uniref:Uncharacterized protein n=1 Tax=Strombidium inclinatum TaxID=197538 RepID=A0A7S3IPS9_9SPIT
MNELLQVSLFVAAVLAKGGGGGGGGAPSEGAAHEGGKITGDHAAAHGAGPTVIPTPDSEQHKTGDPTTMILVFSLPIAFVVTLFMVYICRLKAKGVYPDGKNSHLQPLQSRLSRKA